MRWKEGSVCAAAKRVRPVVCAARCASRGHRDPPVCNWDAAAVPGGSFATATHVPRNHVGPRV
eukprot:297162-Rhodomonas_salina.1